MNNYEKVLRETSLEFPKFRVIPKDESRFMRFLAFLLFFNRAFMTDFVTTIGNRMWVPNNFSGWSPDMRAILLRHERVHLRQQARYGLFLYVLMYLLWPVPVLWAAGRRKLEQEAYEESLRASAEYLGVEYITRLDVRTRYIEFFTSAQYAWMWTGRKSVAAWYDATVAAIVRER